MEFMDLTVSRDEVGLEVLVACCLDDLRGGFLLEVRCHLDCLLLVEVLTF